MAFLPGAVPVEGGLPLFVDGQIYGAIGVSGMPSDKDGIVAQAGADFAATLSLESGLRHVATVDSPPEPVYFHAFQIDAVPTISPGRSESNHGS